MSVEFVLKLIGRLDVDNFTLQNQWNDRREGSFEQFDGIIIEGVLFRRQFSYLRNDQFPLDNLFENTELELHNDRFVIISLSVGCDYHNYIIYDQLSNGEFLAVTKGQDINCIDNVREIVISMMGTDILTYTISQ